MIRLRGNMGALTEGAEQLRAVAAAIPEATEQLAAEASVRVEEALRETAPISKPVPGGRAPGSLKKSIGFDLSGTKAEFYASDVAEYVIGGTPPHQIEGAAGPLHFYWEVAGGFVTLMRVQHPGTKPNDFRQPALDVAADEAMELLEQVGDEILGEFA